MKHTKTHLKGYLTYSFITTNNHMHFLSAFPLLFDSRDGLRQKRRDYPLSIVHAPWRTTSNPQGYCLTPQFDLILLSMSSDTICVVPFTSWMRCESRKTLQTKTFIPSCTSLGAARMSCHDQFTRTLRLFSLHEEHNYDYYYYYMRCIPLFGRKRKNQRLSPLCKETNKLFLFFFFIPTNIHHIPLSCSSKYLCI